MMMLDYRFLDKLFVLEQSFYDWTVSEEFLLVCLIPVALSIWSKFKS